LSYVQFEGEDKYDLRKMLENDLRAEQQLIQRIRERIDFARENRDHGIDDLLRYLRVTRRLLMNYTITYKKSLEKNT
jgi:DNA-binding ferritin-like protein